MNGISNYTPPYVKFSYSEEVVVGEYEGKPVYQKMFYSGTSTNSTSNKRKVYNFTFTTSPPAYERLILITGHWYIRNSAGDIYMETGCPNLQSDLLVAWSGRMGTNSGSIWAYFESSASNQNVPVGVSITLQYVKS